MKADAIGLLMWIDTVIYGFVDYVYDIFDKLAKLNLFKAENYQTIVSRIYVVLGLIMLFALAYSLLKAVINPDEFAKGETSFPKLIKNVVVSLVIIAVLPTVFTVAFNFQNAVLNKNTIPGLIFGVDSEDYNKATDANAGRDMSYYVLSAFLHPNFDWCNEKGYTVDDHKSGDVNLSACASEINGDGDWLLTNGENLKSVTEKFKAGTYDISAFNDFGESAAAGKLTYNVFISTIAGVFLLYVLLNFCFDMAVRVVKLMFFQIIAPIPVICRVIPGGKLKDVFSDWTKKTISTYVEVFIRIAIMYLGVFMINQVIGNFSRADFGNLGPSQKLITEALVIMGVVIFMRQAPKLIGDMFHLDSGGMKLGLMDKLAMGGALTAGAVAGGAFGTLGRNLVSGARGVKNADGAWNKVKAGLFGAASVGAGTLSGAARGFNRGKGAKNLADMKKAAGGAVAATSAAKAKRDAYRASHTSASGALDTLGNVMLGHISDAGVGVAEYFGVNNVEDLVNDNKLIDDIASKKKAVATSVESVIDKEASKAKSDFKLGAFNATELRRRKLAIQDAQAGNLLDASGRKITVAEAQQAYDEYRYDFSQAAQNIAFLSKEHFENLKMSSDASERDIYVKFSEASSNADAFRATVSKNIGAPYLQQAGFTIDYLKGDMQVDVKGKPLKSMGDILDVAKANNNREIANRQKQSQSNNSNK
jgi:membrane protein